MKKAVCILAIGALSLYGTICLADDPDPGVKNFDVEGVIFGSWWNGEYQQSSSDESLYNLMSTGADYVGILATWYMDTTPADGEYSTSNVIYSHPQKSVSDSDLIHVINEAKASGRKVMLKLHARVVLNDDPFGGWSDSWAGKINPSDPPAWFSSYTQFVEHYAALCQTNGVDLLCFGTELTSMTKPEYAAEWDMVIDAIEALYSGKLTFSSNMYLEYERIPFWGRCDYLGIGPYFSLTANEADPDLDAIVDGWTESPVDGKLMEKLETWHQQHNKPVLFTEIGYCSVDTSPYQPWKGTGTWHENWPLQKRCYDALFLALQAKSWFAGMFWWDWLCDPAAGTTGLNRKEYTPQNKDAENSLKNFYLGVNPIDISYIKIVGSNGVEIPDGVINIGSGKNLYAAAFDSGSQVLGFIPCTWEVSGSGGTLEANDVGFAKLNTTGAGNLTVTATDSAVNSDSVTFEISQRYLRVPSEYSTIQAAIDAAGYGDIILVDPGIYNEPTINMKTGVKLLGDITKAKNIIINGGIAIPGSADENTEISGFTITNSGGYGIVGQDAFAGIGSVVIKNNILKDSSERAINIGRSSPKVYNNIIGNNSGGGILIQGTKDSESDTSPEIINNVIISNTAVRGGGIYVLYSDARIYNNIIINNYATQYGGGLKGWQNGVGFEIGYNDVWNNTAGLGEPNYGSILPGTGAISADPLFIDADYSLSGASPCVDAGNPDAQYDDIIDGSRNDMGIYGGPTPFGLPVWVLNMAEMNWYENIALYNSTGAAACQMILNYIIEGAADPAIPLLTQDTIYEYARSPEAFGPELTPAEVDKALGHFDPYDILVSNWADGYDSYPGGNPYQGYNYNVDTYDPASGLEAINNYMRDICHWMAYSVTKEEWWKAGELVARPNTPAAIPICGTYDHWVAVKGCVTSENPCPEPQTNPWNTPDFTVYGFWMKDPLVTGIGQNTYKTAAECKATYFLPLETDDDYDGLFLQVAEPPGERSTASVEVSRPAPSFANLAFIGAEIPVVSGGRFAQGTAMSFSADSAGMQESLKVKNSWRDLVDPYLLTDAEVINAFEGTKIGEYVLVHRLDSENADYYLVPFGKNVKRRGFLTSGVIILDAALGYFKEASWTKEPETLLEVDAQRAITLVRRYIIKSYHEELKELMQKYRYGYSGKKGEFYHRYHTQLRREQQELIRKHIRILRLIRYAETQLVWESNSYSPSPYKPYWKVDVDTYTWYVTQGGRVIQ